MLRANTSFFAGSRLVSAGDLVDPKDPVVKGRERLFDAPESGVEQATAAPGEKRTTTTRATRSTRAKGKS